MVSKIGLLATLVIGLCHGAVGQVQELSMAEFLNGDKLPQTYTPETLPEDFRAVSLQTGPSGGGIFDMFGGLGGLMMMGMSGGNSGMKPDQAAIMSMMDTNWTRGDTVKFYGHDYLVCYKMNMNLGDMMTLRPSDQEHPFKIEVKLNLVRTDSISSISPKPEVTKAKMMEMASMFDMSKVAAKKTATLSNLKQIGLATNMYMSDNDDVLPNGQTTYAVQQQLMPYIKNVEVFKTHNPNGGEFVMVPQLRGASLNDVPSPAETPIFYETEAWPDGTRCVAYIDGHVKALDDQEYNAALMEVAKVHKNAGAKDAPLETKKVAKPPTAKKKPPTKPKKNGGIQP